MLSPNNWGITYLLLVLSWGSLPAERIIPHMMNPDPWDSVVPTCLQKGEDQKSQEKRSLRDGRQWVLAAGKELTAPTLVIGPHRPKPHRFTVMEQDVWPSPPLQATSAGAVAIRGGASTTRTCGQGDQVLAKSQ